MGDIEIQPQALIMVQQPKRSSTQKRSFDFGGSFSILPESMLRLRFGLPAKSEERIDWLIDMELSVFNLAPTFGLCLEASDSLTLILSRIIYFY